MIGCRPALLLFGAVFLASCAQFPKVSSLADNSLAAASKPAPAVGQKAVWCVGKSLGPTCDEVETVVLDVDKNGCTTVERGGRDQHTFCTGDGPYFVPTAWQTEAFGNGERRWTTVSGELWPLKVGTRFMFLEEGNSDQNRTWQRQGELRVTAVEEITVPAGTFETFKINILLGFDRSYTMNYAPEIGSLVYFHRDDPGAGPETMPRYLKEFQEPA